MTDLDSSSRERTYDPIHRVSMAFEREGGRLWVSTWLDHGGHLPEHFHPTLEECWEVLEGSAGVKVDGRGGSSAADDPVLVGCGVRHELRNTSGSRGAPADRGHARGPARGVPDRERAGCREGLYNARNLPTGLRGAAWLSDFALRFRDETVMRSPPPAVQRVLVPVAARLTRRYQATPS